MFFFLNMVDPSADTDISKLEALFLLSDNDEGPTVIEEQKAKGCTLENNINKKSFLQELADLDKNIDTLMTNNATFSDLDSIRIGKYNNKDSVVHNGDTDSSDDEEKRNFLEQKYNDYGRQIKSYLNKQENEQTNRKMDKIINTEIKKSNISSKLSDEKYELKVAANTKNAIKTKCDVYTDPIFGIRLINPVISSATLTERMTGKLPVRFAQIKRHVQSGNLDSDWVVAGCIVSKSPVKTSQKGAQYSIWLLSDLHNDLKTVSLFLFRNAHKELWKTNSGTVIGILNPSVLEKREGSKDEACLSVDNPQRIMIFGQSKDIGTCKSRKKNGDPCTAFVNTHTCEFCIFHVKQEYIQHSKRSELQSSFAGNGLTNLRNKVLGKNEVFYGGQSYIATPIQKNRKQMAKDKNRLNFLSDGMTTNSSSVNRQSIINSLNVANKLNAARIEVTSKQRDKDLKRLQILKEYMPECSTRLVNNVMNNELEISNKTAIKDSNHANSTNCNNIFIPKLSSDNGKIINLNIDAHKTVNKANFKALEWVKKNGPIKKTDPSNLKGTILGKKRILEELNHDQINKKMKVEEKTSFRSDRFKKLMEASSINEHLVTLAENEKQKKYFDILEKKEAMEEKMLNTFKVACKAVSCSVCKYTSFSASEKCKKERHQLKVTDSFKRFFQCQDCSNRTVTLDKIPKFSCKNCQSSHWVRAPMMKERIVKSTSQVLSIRGDEEKFIGSVMSESNINLLVPE
ncbi:protein MCM10 homolog isoform X1 [Ctenocephalides felis]|uniref:protein MCM10 homolog isoform X1 n=2 Tax=Ctenocephalides felis TaxID=7515 RepID=UPI000E6E1AE0|nr:protein MCM10 homolog isoform X1 [Ctenocephalides felis]